MGKNPGGGKFFRNNGFIEIYSNLGGGGGGSFFDTEKPRLVIVDGGP
jgi:hypothetical protein